MLCTTGRETHVLKFHVMHHRERETRTEGSCYAPQGGRDFSTAPQGEGDVTTCTQGFKSAVRFTPQVMMLECVLGVCVLGAEPSCTATQGERVCVREGCSVRERERAGDRGRRLMVCIKVTAKQNELRVLNQEA